MVYSREYRWDERGWRSVRAFQPFRGMVHDVRRRLPYYWSDIKDGFNYRTFAGTIRIYFVNLLPALAFILDMRRQTDGFYGVNEALFSSAFAALVFSLFSAQPLTIVGVTGLISLFNYTIYDIVRDYDVTLYPAVMVWVGIWSGITHWIVSIFNWCDYMRYVTDFSSTTFGLYVGTIYVIKGVEELVADFDGNRIANGYASVMIAILYFLTIFLLEKIRGTTFFKPFVRDFISDYAYPIATIFWVGFSHIPGVLADTDITNLPVTTAFYPTRPRPYVWLVEFWHLPVRWVFVSLPLGMLITLLFYYDHNVSSITAQARHFPLKKPAGFHWDFFLLGWTTFISAFIGIPFPNGLVPQAPVHTDALTTYEDQLKVVHTDDDETLHQKSTVALYVTEQRISHFLMGLALVGTMTGPLLTVLQTMPRAIFAGVFFIVGSGGILGNPIVERFLFLFKEHRFINPGDPLLKVRKRKIGLFIFWQLLGYAMSVAISQTIAAIGFPVIITALIPFRTYMIPKMFSAEELSILDALTADADVVLASLGGKPVMREERMSSSEESIDEEKDMEAVGDEHSSSGGVRQRYPKRSGGEPGLDRAKSREEKS